MSYDTNAEEGPIFWEVGENDSFYCYLHDYKHIESSSLLNQLIEKGKKSLTGRARICFHNSPIDELQSMLIYHDQRTEVPVHKHLLHAEFILPKAGTFKINYFNSVGDKIVKTVLTTENSLIPMLTPTGTWHDLEFTGPTLFYEFKKGPFNKKDTLIL